MPVEVLGIDHVYLSVRDPARSEAFYDTLMGVLGFRKASSTIDGDPHVHYYNRQLGLTLRPARDPDREHDPYAAGLHHLCLRVLGAGTRCATGAACTWSSPPTSTPRPRTALPVRDAL